MSGIKKDNENRMGHLMEEALESRFNEEHRLECGEDGKRMEKEQFERFKKYANNLKLSKHA